MQMFLKLVSGFEKGFTILLPIASTMLVGLELLFAIYSELFCSSLLSVVVGVFL